jgi:hypothetical protein
MIRRLRAIEGYALQRKERGNDILPKMMGDFAVPHHGPSEPNESTPEENRVA